MNFKHNLSVGFQTLITVIAVTFLVAACGGSGGGWNISSTGTGLPLVITPSLGQVYSGKVTVAGSNSISRSYAIVSGVPSVIADISGMTAPLLIALTGDPTKGNQLVYFDEGLGSIASQVVINPASAIYAIVPSVSDLPASGVGVTPLTEAAATTVANTTTGIVDINNLSVASAVAANAYGLTLAQELSGSNTITSVLTPPTVVNALGTTLGNSQADLYAKVLFTLATLPQVNSSYGSNVLQSSLVLGNSIITTAFLPATFNMDIINANSHVTGYMGAPIVPQFSYAYVANAGDNDISQYTISPDGALISTSYATIAAGTNPSSVTITHSGQYAYVANSGNGTVSGSVSQYTINAGGALVPMSPATIPAGTSPISVAIDPSSLYVYVTNSGDGTISQYTIGAGGELTPMSMASVTAGTSPSSIAVDPFTRYVYVANSGDGTISQYTIGAGGELTPMSTATVAAGTKPYSITVDPSGQHVYVANTGSSTVSQYTIGSGGALTLVSTVATGSNPFSVVVDPSGQYVYVANAYSNSVSQYTIGAGGALTPMSIAAVAAGTNPISVTINPSGQYLYVANTGSNSVSQYNIGVGGALTPMPTPIVTAGTSPISIITTQ